MSSAEKIIERMNKLQAEVMEFRTTAAVLGKAMEITQCFNCICYDERTDSVDREACKKQMEKSCLLKHMIVGGFTALRDDIVSGKKAEESPYAQELLSRFCCPGEEGKEFSKEEARRFVLEAEVQGMSVFNMMSLAIAKAVGEKVNIRFETPEELDRKHDEEQDYPSFPEGEDNLREIGDDEFLCSHCNKIFKLKEMELVECPICCAPHCAPCGYSYIRSGTDERDIYCDNCKDK